MKKRKIWLIIAIIGLVVMGCTSPNDNDTNNTTVNPCANGHDMQPVAGEMEVAPTCEDEGFGKVACARTGCGYTENGASIPALGHTGTVEPFAATCTIAGNSALSGDCVRFAQCSHVVMGAVIPAAHIFTEWEETIPATCLVAATDTEKCEVCGELGTKTEDGHDPLNHSTGELSGAIAATCETDGYTGGTGNCIRCAITITSGTVIPKWNHHYHDWTAPTCTTAGNSQRECVNDCGTIDTRDTGYAALGHTGSVAAFAATCTTAGNSALSGNCVRFAQCAHVVTGEVIPAFGHLVNSWDWATYNSSNGHVSCDRAGCSGGLAAIGNTGPAGGIIFYVAASGFTVQGYSGATGSFAEYTAYYLEAAPANASGSTMRWSNTNILIPNLSQNSSDTIDRAIGRGRLNTALITAAHSADTTANNAAKATAAYSQGGKDDWFLPSFAEINQMYIQRSHVGITTGTFWSSSQVNNDLAWNHNFVSGNEGGSFKNNNFSVRAIRAF